MDIQRAPGYAALPDASRGLLDRLKGLPWQEWLKILAALLARAGTLENGAQRAPGRPAAVFKAHGIWDDVKALDLEEILRVAEVIIAFIRTLRKGAA